MLLPVNLGFSLLSSEKRQLDHDAEKQDQAMARCLFDNEHDGNEFDDGHAERQETVEALYEIYDEEHSERDERRRRASSTSMLQPLMSAPHRPQWYFKLKSFLFPPNNDNDVDGFAPNYRYTPILSGLTIPFSILLEIPGLTEHWYIRTGEDNQTVEIKPNPFLLNVGLGFSMACALIANAALVTRFLERKIRLMTLTCVVALTVHDIINIAAVTIFGVEHRFDDGFTYGTSFWMVVCSTIASTITNCSLIVDLIRTPEFATSGSGLTRKQRSLLIIVILLLCYIALGAGLHSVLLDTNFVDALYFTICSIETIGFGDISPVSTGARIFTCTYATFGIINLALAVALARETIVEALEIGYRKHLHNVRMNRRHLHWKRRVTARWKEAVEWRLGEHKQPVWVRDDSSGGRSSMWMWVYEITDRWHWMWAKEKGGGLGDVAHPHGMCLNLEALTDAQLEGAAFEVGVPLCDLLPPNFWKARRDREMERRKRTNEGPAPPINRAESSSRGRRSSDDHSWVDQAYHEVDLDEVPLTHARIGKMVAMLGGFALAVSKSDAFVKGKVPVSPPVRTRKPKRGGLDYLPGYLAVDEEEGKKAFYAKFSVAWMLFLMFWFVGSGIFTATEGWSFATSMYFCFISFTTIGYGDFSPKTPAGRSVFVVWALFGVATMTILISVVSEAYTSRYKNVLKTGLIKRLIEKYKAKQVEERRKMTQDWPAPQIVTPSESTPNRSNNSPTSPSSPIGGALPRASHTLVHLEQLPRKIIHHCQAFREHIHFFNQDTSGGKEATIPDGLKKLMEEITDVGEGSSKKAASVHHELLHDKDARHTLFALSIERELRKMVEAAEEALGSLEPHRHTRKDSVH